MTTRAAIVLLAAALALPAPARAQEIKVAGTDVPAPRRTKFVAPAYPVEAQMRGLRGIVILELVIDEQGKVATADVVRSVQPFDEAALSAARQWEYEPTKVDGRPVRVRVTVPITFALKLPEMTRQDGVPEMRQGAAPGFPPGMEGPARVVAEVTLQPDGSVAEASVRSGESPWAEGLLQAIRTWRFVVPAPGTEVAFTVEANFVSPGRPGQPPRVELKAFDLKKREAGAAPSTPPVTVPPTTDPFQLDAPAKAEPSPSPAATPEPQASAPPAPEPTPAPAHPSAAATPAPPPEEIISGPVVAPPTAPPPQPGFSAVRDVTLAIGVPDLVKGRRPVVPPVARMAGTSGQVLLTFAVDAAGVTSVQKVDGPDLLKDAARQAVASWSFRRTTADRMYLAAVFTFDGDQARAEVRRAD